jgi:hypothetical protein
MGMDEIAQTAAAKEPMEFTINKSGDHHIRVRNTTRKKITITLYLNIE